VSLDYYCRDCHHLTDSVDGNCMWCNSPSIGIQSHLCQPRRAMGPITEPDDNPPTKHQRLKDGFAMLNGNL